jgi:hypothetical protein
MIWTMQLDDVGPGNRRIIVGGHVHPLDDLTRRAVLDWLDYRRSRRPNTANLHLLITQKTAAEVHAESACSPQSLSCTQAAANSSKDTSSAAAKAATVKNAGVGARPVSILRSVSADTPAAAATSTMLRSPRA